MKRKSTIIDPGLSKKSNIILSDDFKHDFSSLKVTTFAGTSEGYKDGDRLECMFSSPTGFCFDEKGNMYLCDYENHVIRMIDTEGQVSVYAGHHQGFFDGNGEEALFYGPCSVCVDESGNLFVCDSLNHKIRKIDIDRNVTTIAGSERGFVDGYGTSALFQSPQGICIDNETHELYVTDFNHRIRKIDRKGRVSTFAGSGEKGDKDGKGTRAMFNKPSRLCMDNEKKIYVTEYNNHKIRVIDQDGNCDTFAGGSVGFCDEKGQNARFNHPVGIFFDPYSELIFVCDQENEKIRVINKAGIVKTVAGTDEGDQDGFASECKFNYPHTPVVRSGILYVSDLGNDKIRTIAIPSLEEIYHVTQFLMELYSSNEFRNFKIISGGNEYSAHKFLLLSRIPYHRADKLDSVISPRFISSFIEYLYLDSFSANFTFEEYLKFVAEIKDFSMDHLKYSILRKASIDITYDNAITLLQFLKDQNISFNSDHILKHIPIEEMLSDDKLTDIIQWAWEENLKFVPQFYKSTYEEDYKKIFHQLEFTDSTFLVTDIWGIQKEYSFHKAILSHRSDYFATFFRFQDFSKQEDTSHSSLLCIKSFDILFDFIYGITPDEDDLNLGIIIFILVWGDSYLIHNFNALSQLCSRRFSQIINETTSNEYLNVVSEKYSDEMIKDILTLKLVRKNDYLFDNLHNIILDRRDKKISELLLELQSLKTKPT